jgi:putative hydrolase of the HAD superfamily
MPSREPRAVIFDLDDTLYPYEQFRVSGFRAVAAHLARTRRSDERAVLAALLRSSRGPDRNREIQACLELFALPSDLLDELLVVVRDHAPRLVLSVHAASALTFLRRSGWRIGILTNGEAEVQERKIDALGLWSAVDTVVYATTCGTGNGKPDPVPFRDAARQLDVEPHRVVFVGNDEVCDVGGAIGAGMHAVLCSVWVRPSTSTRARRIVNHLSEVPAAAQALLKGGSSSHAA